MHGTRRQALAGMGTIGLWPRVASAVPMPPTPGPGRLSNPAASAEARALYAYLCSQYRHRTLTGQQERPGGNGQELAYLRRTTGRLPAILGLDYIDPRDDDGLTERAVAWHRAGGLVSICWHWGAPDVGTGYENSKRDFDVAAALRPGTRQNRLMLDQMAHVGDLLARLRDRRVPVLWRPFHEFSGTWFWWGKHGPDAFKALWRLMYDDYVRHRGLDNLIWVLGWAGQNVDSAYYPGRDRVDIAGADIYADDHGNLAPMFGQVRAIVGDTVPICLHENGPVPDPATLGPDADWLWFLTWHTRWLTDPSQNTAERLRAFYASDRYVTLDELPRARPPASARR